MRRLLSTTALLAASAAFLFTLFGCSHKLTGTLVANNPPHTVVFVQGPVDTVNHLVHLYWFGSDADGYVRGYEVKLVNPADPVAADSAWRFTTAYDTLLAIQTPAGYARPTLYVRAIDNEGERDPHPAVETFQFRNNPPVVTWNLIPNRGDKSDTTFAAVTVGWSVWDPDGQPAKVKCRIWLDGRESTPDIITGLTQFTVPSDRFLVNGAWTSGPRTISVQAIDDGGMAGNTISLTWYVRSPVANPSTTPGHRPGRLLIVDDLPSAADPANYIDSLYTNTALRNLPAGSWRVLKIESVQPFKTNADVAETMSLYDAVVWYRGPQTSISTLMESYQAGLESYLDTGGNLYLEGLYLQKGVNAPGALSQDFARNYLDCNPGAILRGYYRSLSNDSTTCWANKSGSFPSDMFSDTLLTNAWAPSYGNEGGIRVFNVNHRADVALLASPNMLIPANPDSMTIGVSVLQPSGGRAVVLSLPILAPGRGNGPRFLAKVFKQLGLIW